MPGQPWLPPVSGGVSFAPAAGGGFTVHGLEADSAKVAAARKSLLAEDIYGQVSIEQFSGSRLPYTDNLVNLAVVDDTVLSYADDKSGRILSKLYLEPELGASAVEPIEEPGQMAGGDVLVRACTTREKGDVLDFLLTFK